MRRYADRGSDSGVVAYEAGPDSIVVRFERGGSYRYTYASAGKRKVERMKRLAAAGEGLCTFINREVKEDFAEKVE